MMTWVANAAASKRRSGENCAAVIAAVAVWLTQTSENFPPSPMYLYIGHDYTGHDYVGRNYMGPWLNRP